MQSNTSEIYWVNLQLKKGDHEAFHTVYVQNQAILYHFVRKYVKDHNQIQDILHDAFCSLWHARENLTCQYPVSNYLFRITRNLVFKYLKKQASSIVSYTEDYSDILHDTAPSSEVKIIEDEYREILEKAVSQLPPKRKRIFKLSREEGKSYKEIAQFLNVSHQTVKEHMSYAMKSIKEEIRKEEGIIFKFTLLITFFDILQ